ncbi:hypothetical protein [Streptomyces sp. NPDC006645]|uniref:hypothetical protein n=1 Tax=unclassified Streptomyces TaxID=2593676 RepID=UPI0033A10546
MDLELLPDTGVASIRLGMSVREAVQAGRAMGFLPDVDDVGDVGDTNGGDGGDSGAGGNGPGQVFLEHAGYDMEFTLGFTKGSLTDIEVWRFREEDADVRVVLDGLDVFRTPSPELLRQLAERGHTVEENDLGYDTLPELKMILTNHSSFEYPTDDEGHPLYFDYVLVTSLSFEGPPR